MLNELNILKNFSLVLILMGMILKQRTTKKEGNMSNEVEMIYAGSNLAKPLGYAYDGPYKGWLLVKHPDGQWVTIAPISEIIDKYSRRNEKISEVIDDKMLKFYVVCTFKLKNVHGYITMIVESKDVYSAIKLTQKLLDEKYPNGCVLNVIQI